MLSDKRKSQRKPIERHAWLDRANGSPLVECVLGNMSDTGAKLLFTELPELPDQFILRLSVDGRVARKCRVAWKTDKEMGVQFIARLMSPTPQARQMVET